MGAGVVMSETTRPTLAELEADGITPEIMIDMIDAQKSMASEYFCNCGTHGGDKSAIEVCKETNCYFRKDGEIDAPYLDWPELDATRAHYVGLSNEATP